MLFTISLIEVNVFSKIIPLIPYKVLLAASTTTAPICFLKKYNFLPPKLLPCKKIFVLSISGLEKIYFSVAFDINFIKLL